VKSEHHLAIAKHVVFSVYEPVVERVVEVLDTRAIARHAPGAARRLHFVSLHKDGRVGKELIATTVIEVQMRIDHVPNIIGS
jgi:hypothetical protein